MKSGFELIVTLAILIALQGHGCLSQRIVVSNHTKISREGILGHGSTRSAASGEYSPRILTKFVYVTSYEFHTVTLPCEILNLPQDMHVIWQYGKRGESNQTVLTIGGTQLETNYRVRVVSNTTSFDKTMYESVYHNESAWSSLKPDSKLTVNNLEIRKLQISDSGWYECQLPTKPTQINYVYLEVLSLPKIEANLKHMKGGESVELTCQVRNLPKRFELTWIFNEKRINTHHTNQTKLRRHNSDKSSLEQSSSSHHVRRAHRDLFAHDAFSITTELKDNLTISRLTIKSLSDSHRGVYKCRYDKIETKYNLDFKGHARSKIKMFDYIYAAANSSHRALVLANSEFILIIIALFHIYSASSYLI